MSILSQVNLNQALTPEEYEERLIRYQVALGQLAYQVYVQKRPVALVFEGWDAAGKGGAIKRLTERLDPRGYVVYPIAAPAGEDQTHHYLYRFWRRLPERGQIAVFDRSWYGRVMVERVEGFCTEAEWKRAYREINQFERQLVDFGAVIFKFWVHISKDEQLRRFQERENTPYKAWKLTAEDWRNREKWDLYEGAVEEMLLKTSTVTAPWTIVEGTDKAWARVKVLKTVVDTLSKELDFQPDILSAAPEKDLEKRQKKPAKAKSEPAKGSTGRKRRSPAGQPKQALTRTRRPRGSIMDIDQIQQATKQRIWQAIAGSGVNVSAIPKADLEKLVDSIAQGVLEEFDALQQSALPPQLQKLGPAGDAAADEETLWEGRPFLSLVEYYVITSQRVRIITGLLGRGYENIELVRIKDLDWRQGVGERVFGIGDIIVTSVDATEPRAVLRNVKHPDQVYEILRRAMLEARKKYHIIFQQEM